MTRYQKQVHSYDKRLISDALVKLREKATTDFEHDSVTMFGKLYGMIGCLELNNRLVGTPAGELHNLLKDVKEDADT